MGCERSDMTDSLIHVRGMWPVVVVLLCHSQCAKESLIIANDLSEGL